MQYFDPMVYFSKYDNDGDGKTDAISIVYAGQAETWGQGLWPHASGSNQKRDGVTVSRYMMTNLGTSLGLYTFAHEVGHMLFGWPDLYGFGNYCIMGNASSQKNPVGINDLYRADQGWIPLFDVTKDTNALFSAKVNGTGYRYTNPANSKESFFWSNVKSDGRFSTIAGDGLLLLHFDKGIGSNNPPNTLSLAVVQADGKKDLDKTMWPEPGSDAKDYFHAGGVSEFSDAKFATAKWNNGSASGLRIYEVAAISDDMKFKVGNGPVDPSAGTSSGGSGMAGNPGNDTGGAPAGGSAGQSGGAGGVSASGAGGGAVGGSAVGGSGSGGSGSGVGTSGSAGVPLNQAGFAGSAASQAGSAGSVGAPEAAPPADDASCACRVGQARSPLSSGALSLAIVALLARLRRRSRRQA